MSSFKSIFTYSDTDENLASGSDAMANNVSLWSGIEKVSLSFAFGLEVIIILKETCL